VDEADNTNWRDRNGLVSILNGGFAKSGAVVPRCVGEDFDAKDFSVWGPKALATKGLKGIPDTTLPRSVIIHMKRRTKEETVTRFRERQARLESARYVPRLPDGRLTTSRISRIPNRLCRRLCRTGPPMRGARSLPLVTRSMRPGAGERGMPRST
jgi:hypothetical protein